MMMVELKKFLIGGFVVMVMFVDGVYVFIKYSEMLLNMFGVMMMIDGGVCVVGLVCVCVIV